jgi:hypothetical protein
VCVVGVRGGGGMGEGTGGGGEGYLQDLGDDTDCADGDFLALQAEGLTVRQHAHRRLHRCIIIQRLPLHPATQVDVRFVVSEWRIWSLSTEGSGSCQQCGQK